MLARHETACERHRRSIYRRNADSRELVRAVRAAHVAGAAAPAARRGPAALGVELSRARLVAAAAVPSRPAARVHALAHVHRVRGRGRDPAGGRRRELRPLAAGDDGAMNPVEQGVEVKRRGTALGFAAVGITTLERNTHAAELDRWLAAGHAGTMTYLHRQAERRKDPARIMPQARVAVVTLTNYFHGEGVRSPVAQYAWSS